MSALLPISRTVTPLTVIRPSAMTCSAPRREATPARARIFWRRSSVIDPPDLSSTPHPIPPPVGGGERSTASGSALHCTTLSLLTSRSSGRIVLCERYLRRRGGLDRALEAGHVHLLAQHLGELLDLGQLGQVLEPEVEEELLGGAVKDGPAHHLLAAQDADEPLLQQGLDHAPGLDPPEVDDLGQGDRLLVGHHRQRLQGLDRKARGGLGVEQLPDPVVVFGPGRDLPAPRYL